MCPFCVNVKNKLGGGKSGLREKVGSCGGGQVRGDSDLGWKAAVERKSWGGLQAGLGGCSIRARTIIEMRRRFRVMAKV